MIAHNGKPITIAMRNRKPINLIARNGKAMFGEFTAISLAAKAAIIAEYGDVVWQDTRDYAKAHPAIVEFINQDPHLACSISPNSNKERYIITSGIAGIDTGIYVNPKDVLSFAFGCDNLPSSGYNRVTPYGCVNQCWMRIERVNWIESALSSQSNVGICTFEANKVYEIEVNTNGVYKIGSITVSNRGSLFATTTNTLWLFKKAGNYSDTYIKRMRYFRVKDSEGNDRIHLIPHLTADGQCGMLDLVSATFHPNANTSGQFTIQVTDKQ